MTLSGHVRPPAQREVVRRQDSTPAWVGLLDFALPAGSGFFSLGSRRRFRNIFPRLYARPEIQPGLQHVLHCYFYRYSSHHPSRPCVSFHTAADNKKPPEPKPRGSVRVTEMWMTGTRQHLDLSDYLSST